MNHSTPGLIVHHQLPEFTQTHVRRVSDAIQPSHPLLSPTPPAFNLPRIRVFSNESALRIRWPNFGVSASTSVLPVNTQDWPPLGWTGWISLHSKGVSRVFSNTTVQKHHFFCAQLSFFLLLFFTMDHVHLHTDDRGWDGWMASLTRRTWVWVNSGSWWWTGKPSVLQSMGSPRVGHDWATELNWLTCIFSCVKFPCWINRQKQMERHPGSQ